MSISKLTMAKMALGSVGASPFEYLDEDDPDENTTPKVAGEETDPLVTDVKDYWLYIVVAVAIVSTVLTMAATVGLIVDIASYTCLALAPYISYQKVKLNSMGGMRGQQNELRNSVNALSRQNDVLHKNVNDLEMCINDLQTVETDLEAIVKDSGANADRLVEVIEENDKLQAEIRKKLERNVMQTIFRAIMDSDRGEDFHLNESELRRLEMRLSNLPSISFDKERFRELCGDEMTSEQLMKLLRNLQEEGMTEKDSVFHMRPALPKQKAGRLNIFG